MLLDFSLKAYNANSILFCIWINTLYPKELFYSLKVCVSLFIKTRSAAHWGMIPTIIQVGLKVPSGLLQTFNFSFEDKSSLFHFQSSRFFEPCKWSPLVCRMSAVVSNCSWKERKERLFLPAVSECVTFQTIKVMEMDTGQGAIAPAEALELRVLGV